MKTQPSFSDVRFDNNMFWKFQKYLKLSKINREKCRKLLDELIKNKDDINHVKRAQGLLEEHDIFIKDQNTNIELIKNEISIHPASLG